MSPYACDQNKCLTPHPQPLSHSGERGARKSDRCRFFILGWGQDKEDKEGKKTRGKNLLKTYPYESKKIRFPFSRATKAKHPLSSPLL
ncbi:hypothetical protein MC7420_6191 [Coleofasciculus chthonoplastes PCC 7420]|uniref:Uncharacterized protein n=1 Tax=Coleofasciculus chthonoplastes PCC 7420 TaxID=118168 RepID=B4VTX9_9CYAN|nr:hypothetical protein MC7420_6191 [Coleofasciculus chthonoplastes PCC 7420]